MISIISHPRKLYSAKAQRTRSLTGCGNDGGDWMTHKLEHELGGLYDEELALMAKKCAVGVGGEMGSAKVLNEEAMLAIYRASM